MLRLQGLAAIAAAWLLTPYAAVAAAASDNSTVNGTTSSIVPNRYIVELEAQSNPSSFTTLLRTHPVIADSNAVQHLNLTSDVFTGASIETNASASQLAALPGVVNVWPVRTVSLPDLPLRRALGTSGTAQSSTSNYSTHGMTGVDVLQAKGIKGSGVVVGVVDTGIYYPHPDLGGGIGPGKRVLGGWDFIGANSTYPDGPTYPGPDPLDQDGHGTHVAGILGADGPVFNGVAPEVNFMAYKVIGLAGSTTVDIVMAGFLRALQDGVDVITCSLSQIGGFEDDPLAVVIQRINAQGVIVTITVGNNGAIGPMSLGDGMSPDSLGVGCVQPDFLPGQGASLTLPGQDSQLIGYFGQNGEQFPPSIESWPVYLVSEDLDDDTQACDPLPAGTPDISQSVVLVRQSVSSCANALQLENLGAAGAQFVLFYSGEPVTPPEISPNTTIGTTLTTVAQLVLDAQKATGKQATFTAPSTLSVVGVFPGPIYGGLACSYTAWGPTYGLDVKPDIVAPGDSILSTYLDDSYAVLSGTSMSTPYVAGVAALYLSQNPGKARSSLDAVKEFNTKVVTSGTSMTWANSIDPANTPIPSAKASVAQVGGGVVNASTVVEAATSVDVAKFLLNDTAHAAGPQTVTITNSGPSPVTYSFSHEQAGGVTLFDFAVGTIWIDVVPSPVPYVKGRAQLPSAITIPAGASQTVQITVNPPNKGCANSSLIPIYSGKVLIEGSNGDQIGIPYLGAAANLNSELNMFTTWAPRAFATLLLASAWGSPGSLASPAPAVQNTTTYTFFSSLFQANLPGLIAPLNYGTEELRWDIFSSDWDQKSFSYPPVIGEGAYLGAATASGQSWGSSGHNSPIDYNQTVGFPMTGVARNDPELNVGWIYTWVGNFANGTLIPDGDYYQRVAALRPFGDRSNVDDWDAHVIPFTVARTFPLDGSDDGDDGSN